MNVLVTICARGGSKGIPGKNIKPVAGIPLIWYTIRTAQRFAEKYSAHIALSTDDGEIRSVAAAAGLASGYSRPDYLASDSAGKIDTIRDLLEATEKSTGIRYEMVLDMDVTSPLRTLEDLEAAWEIIQADKDALTLFSVNNANRNPYFNMVEPTADGYFSIVKKGTDEKPLTRQSAPKVYELNASFYWYRRHFFDISLKSPITDRSLIYVMPHACFDLDHMIDFEFMDYLLSNNKLDFSI